MIKYTFTFPYSEEQIFRGVMTRLDPDEFVVIEDIHPIPLKDGENERYVDRTTIIEMEPEAAATFRFRMGNTLKIRRERTEEELAEERELEERNTVKVTVIVPGMNPPTP